MYKSLMIAVCATALVASVARAQDTAPQSETTTQTAAPATPKLWPQEPEGFAGVKFGTPYSEASKTLIAPACERKGGVKPTDVVMSCRNTHFPLTDKLEIAAEFRYVKGTGPEPEFNGLVLEVTNRRFKEVKAMLLAKYGPPLMADDKVSATSALFGNGAADKFYDWRGDKVKARIVEPPQPLARSRVTIERISEEETAKNVF
jgi:hypothetical protein